MRGLGALDPEPTSVLLAVADDEEKQPASDDDLAKQTQNPLADLISVPLQNNFNFDFGPGNDTQWILNIQPIIPVSLNEKWSLITRTILPVINQPVAAPGLSSDFGLGDTVFTAWFSPKDAGSFIWGVGPVLLIPTSTSRTLGAGEWGAGLSVIGLSIDGPWVYGALVSNVWSFDGSVNTFTLQPFINYNFEAGWYLASGPLITANWEAASGQKWTVPIGIGVGKVVRIGKRPVNVAL
ncbi:MAG: neuromedin U, partial [Planctomycetota bacterium]|nr:neuromedin U [Planctomycetota bacterium]